MKRDTDDARRLIESSGLPEPLALRLLAVVERSRLRPIEQVDVARELIAHCEDALSSGRTAEELAVEFADEDLVGRLIGRGKRAGAARKAAVERVGARGDSIVFVILRDLRYAARRLLQSPAFTAVAVLSLALGIGANTAIFSIVNTMLLRQLPFEEPERLVNIYESSTEFPNNVLSYPDYEDFRDGTRAVFSGVAASNLTIVSIVRDGEVRSLATETVTGEYFTMRGLQAARGRLLGPEDDVTPGAHPVAVLTWSAWQREFGGSEEILGSEVRLNGTPYTIVGVAPESYSGGIRGLDIALFVPMLMVDALEDTGTSRLDKRSWYSIFATARLAPGVSLEQARQVADAVESRLRAEHPDLWREDVAFKLVPTREVVIMPMVDGGLKLAAWLLLGVVGLVLLIACANLASFLLARAVDRRKEVAIRLALGATRGKLVGQLLVETVLLSLVGGVAGVGLAFTALRALGRAELPLPVPMKLEFTLDATVLGFSLAISVLAGVLFGLAPALQATRPDIVGTLRDETAGGGRGARSRLRTALVVGQVAVSVVLLVAAGLFLRSLQRVTALDPGFGTAPAAIVQMALPASRYDAESGRAALERVRGRVAAAPGIRDVGFVGTLHLEQANTRMLEVGVDGVTPPPGRDGFAGDWSMADARYFDAVGIEILRGRNFDDSDSDDARPVAIVSQAFAQRFWPGEDPVGRTFRNLNNDREFTIIGVAADTMTRNLGESPRLYVYFPHSQMWESGATIVASTAGSDEAAVREVISAIRAEIPEATVFLARTMDTHLDIVRLPARLTAVMFGAFAALAMTLATIGLYGLVSYAQAQRVREVGIRMSLGADASSVVRLLVGSGMKLVLVGGALGLVISVLVSRVLSGLLYDVSAWDPLTFVGVVAVLFAVAALAAWIPARRASSIDPVVALRSE